MREIKFRGKRLDTNEWVYGYYVKYEHMDVVKHIIITDWAQVYFNSHLVDPKTVGQFTGLFDKAGKEIYEGDILEIIVPDDGTYYREVIYSSKWAAFVIDFDFGESDIEDLGCALEYFKAGGCEVKVIGNIFENKKLVGK